MWFKEDTTEIMIFRYVTHLIKINNNLKIIRLKSRKVMYIISKACCKGLYHFTNRGAESSLLLSLLTRIESLNGS